MEKAGTRLMPAFQMYETIRCSSSRPRHHASYRTRLILPSTT